MKTQRTQRLFLKPKKPDSVSVTANASVNGNFNGNVFKKKTP